MAEFCFVIPVYNHAVGIANTIEKLKPYDLACIVVDDGSDEACAEVVQRLADVHEHVEAIRHRSNRGKGGAVKTALSRASECGYSHAIQIDADEQHDLSSLEDMLSAARENTDAVILGTPEYDASVPRGRYYGRYATHIWVWINSVSLAIPDAMCGFRIYPLVPVVGLINSDRLGERMDFDIEVLVKLSWRGLRFVSLPVRVRYDQDIPSHFHYIKDNLRISAMHTRLFFGMLVRLPRLLARKLRARRWFK